MKITKEVTFDCAHMLSGHKGLCANLHGHTYKMQVTVEGKPIEEGSSMGMLIDFADLKKAIDTCVMKNFDHAVIFSTAHYRNKAEEALLCWAEENDMHRLILNCRTTAESMSIYIRDEIKKYLYYELKLYNINEVYIKLWETPTSFAEV